MNISDLDETHAHHAAEVGLSLDEFNNATRLLGRAPNKLELGIISAMWSEHCSYKSSRLHLKKLPKSGAQVLIGPGENAGVVDVGDGLALAFKVESHNHPSYIEPFQGAATGVGGILRDVFTMGARPIAAMNLLRFGEGKHPKSSHLFSGVVGGVSSYGNCFGVPTVVSDVAFDACYNGNILVNAFAVGVLKHDGIFLGTAQGIGNPVFYVGAKTGRDGIHGATMASDAFSEEAEIKRPTVQVGDPFKEKLLLEACLECFEQNLLVGIQDMGAAGLTSSSFEMASRGQSGLLLHLDRVPMRESGMTPYEIMLSESQERMLLVAKTGKEQALVEVFQKWGLDCVQIGEVIAEPMVRIMWHGELYTALSPAMLTEEAPLYDRPYEAPKSFSGLAPIIDDSWHQNRSHAELFLHLVSHPSLADQTWVTEKYDHHIGLGTLVGPGEADAALVQIPSSKKAVALTIGCDSRACALDPFEGARRVLARTLLQISCVGGKGLGVSDCLNYGSPQELLGMWQMVRGIEGLADAAETFELPVVSGNVSLYNQTDDKPVFPTPTIALVGLNERPERCAKRALRAPGDLLVYVGSLPSQMSGGELFFERHLEPVGLPSAWDLRRVRAMADRVAMCVQRNQIEAAAHVGKGGLLFTVLKMALSGSLGAKLKFDQMHLGQALPLLFSEDEPAFVLSVKADELESVKAAFVDVCEFSVVGEVIASGLSIWLGDQKLPEFSIDDIKARYHGAINEVVHGHHAA